MLRWNVDMNNNLYRKIISTQRFFCAILFSKSEEFTKVFLKNVKLS